MIKKQSEGRTAISYVMLAAILQWCGTCAPDPGGTVRRPGSLGWFPTFRVILFAAVIAIVSAQVVPASAAGNAQVSITASPAVISPGGSGAVQILVTYEKMIVVAYPGGSTTTPLRDAAVTLSSTTPGVAFSPSSGITDSSGRFGSTFTTTQSVSGDFVIHARAQGSQYTGDGTATVTVRPDIVIKPPPEVPPVMNQAPVAVISVDSYTINAPLTVHFDGRQSSDPDGAINSYSWEFGDGTTGTGYVIDHTYQSGGSYTASLVVHDDLGLSSDNARVLITVSAGGNPQDGTITKTLADQESQAHKRASIELPFQILQSSFSSQLNPEYDLNHDNRVTPEDSRLALHKVFSSSKKIRSCEYTPAAAANYTLEEWNKYCNWQPDPVLQDWSVQFIKSNLQTELASARIAATKLDITALQGKYNQGTLKPTDSFLAEFSRINGMRNTWDTMSSSSIESFTSAYGKTTPEIVRVRDMTNLPKNTLPSTYPVKNPTKKNVPDDQGLVYRDSLIGIPGGDAGTDHPVMLEQLLDYYKVPKENRDNYILENGYALIEGWDFGTCPQSGNLVKGENIVCVVYLKWLPREFFGDAAAKEKATHATWLMPATGDWKSSWNNYGIGIWIPYQPDLVDSDTWIEVQRIKKTCIHGQPDAVCTDEILSKASKKVYFVKDMPSISGIFSDPKYSDIDIINGGDILVTGGNFGENQGTIEVVLDQPIEAYSLTSPAQKLSPLDLMSPDGKHVPITSIQWSNDTIRLKMKDIKANFGNQDGIISIKKKGTPTPAFTAITFGPRWDIRFISGEKFFSPSGERTEGLAYENINGHLVVSHDPRCKDLKIWSGTEGNDYFFAKEKMPPNVKISRIGYVMNNPDNIELKWALQMGKTFYELYTGNIWEWVKFIGSFIAMAFDHHAGRYEAKLWQTETYYDSYTNPYKPPVDFEKDPSTIYVYWENTCLSIGPFYDKNVGYTISFFAEFPEGVDVGA